jgi:NitT/TauT family transport system permease protein
MSTQSTVANERPAATQRPETTKPLMSARMRSILRGAFALLIVASLYQAMAQSGLFQRALVPTLPRIASTLFDMILDGSMLHHAAYTMYRMLAGFALAIVVGLPLGILMGRFRPIEHFFLPLTSALMPIPSLAWVPVFILWFGLGNTVAILIVFYAAMFPMVLNAWSGVRSVNQLWLRAAGAMGANETALFWKVILPGASPFIITGLRQAFLRAWIAVVGAEMIAASDWGLGWVIYDAKEFLNANVMMASLAVIGLIGFAFERLVFGSIERATVQRWGMVRPAKG